MASIDGAFVTVHCLPCHPQSTARRQGTAAL